MKHLNRRQFLAALLAAPAAALVALGLRKKPLPIEWHPRGRWSRFAFREAYDVSSNGSGLSMRLVSRYDASQDRHVSRLDALYASNPLTGELTAHLQKFTLSDIHYKALIAS